MHKPARIVASLPLLLCLFVAGCLPLEQPATRYPIVAAHTLLLDATSFPRDWQADPCEPDCAHDEGYGKATRTFGRPAKAGSVIQDVTNYGSGRISNGMVYYR